MSSDKKVICMIRGGEAGRCVQEKAIEEAKKGGKELVFLHVIDVSSLNLENEDLIDSARKELTWLGGVTLSLALDRAVNSGVRADGALRYGPLFETVQTFLRESPAEILFIGGTNRQVPDFDQRLARINNFVQRVYRETGVPVEIVTGSAPGLCDD